MTPDSSTEMMNFALDVTGTTVSSDKVCTDGFESTNLISSDYSLQRKGFMTEHFIKPPVNITFALPCPIAVSQIVLNPNVGQQHSLQFEIFAAAKPFPRAMKEGMKVQNHTVSSSMNTPDTPPIFYCLAKASTESGTQVCFYNQNSNGSSQRHSNSISVPSSFENKAILRHSKRELMSACSHLCIRITRTRSGSTACVKNVFIWGVPSYFLSNSIRSEILNRYHSTLWQENKEMAKSNNSKINDESVELATSSNEAVAEEFVIPEEFIDPITCEVMSIPMLLPSGKNVDIRTLEKFDNSEASFGRKPRDPYTGVEFTDSCRPLPNASLKNRIDQFLLKHSQETPLTSIARTVGKRKLYNDKKNETCVSSIVSQEDNALSHEQNCNNYSYKRYTGDTASSGGSMSKKPKTVTLASKKQCHVKVKYSPQISSGSTTDNPIDCDDNAPQGIQENNINIKLKNSSVSENNLKESRTVPLQLEKNKNSLQASHGNIADNAIDCDISPLQASHGNTADNAIDCDISPPHDSHENRLKNSLDSALQAMLGQCASKPTTSSSSSNEKDKCSYCQRKTSPGFIFYQAPCSHLVCRECITKTSTDLIQCPICDHSYVKTGIIRAHFAV